MGGAGGRGKGSTGRQSSVPARSLPVSVPPAPRRVVVVDDNALLRTCIARILVRGGFGVDSFESGRDIDAIETRLHGADALITDLAMPGTSGLELARELRRRGCEVPILFISGYGEPSVLVQLRDVPHSSFLEKPFTLKDVVNRLAQLQRSA